MMFLYLLQHVIVVVIAILSAIAIVLVIRVARLILVSIVLVAVAAAVVVVVADRGSEDQKADYKNLQGPRPLRGRHPQPRLPVFQGPLWARPLCRAAQRLSLGETFQW